LHLRRGGGCGSCSCELNGTNGIRGCDSPNCNNGPVPTTWTTSVHIWLQSTQVGGATMGVFQIKVADT